MLESFPEKYVSLLGSLIDMQKKRHVRNGKQRLFDLLHLLELRRNSKATFPIDKVFSLLGLSSEGQNGLFHADYSLSAEKLYTKLARFLITHRRDLRVLSAMHHTAKQLKLPSWVPDWSVPWDVRPLMPSPLGSDDTQANFNATLGKSLELEDTSDLNILKVKGRNFSRIKAIADLKADVLDFGKTLEEKATHLEEMGFPLSSKYPRMWKNYAAALCETIVADISLTDEEEEGFAKKDLETAVQIIEIRYEPGYGRFH
jgi:hypothetical protein